LEGFYPLVIILWEEGSRVGHGIVGHGIWNTLWANACVLPLSGQLDLGQNTSYHGHGNGHIFGSIGIYWGYFSSLLMCFKMVHLFRFSHEWHLNLHVANYHCLECIGPWICLF